MTKPVLIIRNISREGPGLLRDVMMQHHIEADVVDIERGDAVPEIDGYQALVVLGGPASANDLTPQIRNQVVRARQAIDEGVPYFGICLGHQILAKAAGAKVVSGSVKEVGFFDPSDKPYSVALTSDGRADPLFVGVDDSFRVFQLHGETVHTNKKTVVLAESNGVQAIRVGERAYGLQMHVEVMPEMLAVWCAQDPDLANYPFTTLQPQFAEISFEYVATGRRVFENFLTIAGLASIDLTESEQAHVD